MLKTLAKEILSTLLVLSLFIHIPSDSKSVPKKVIVFDASQVETVAPEKTKMRVLAQPGPSLYSDYVDVEEPIFDEPEDVTVEEQKCAEPESPLDLTTEFKNYILELTSTTYTNVDPYIVYAIIERESNWQPEVVNKNSGCTGLMQLAPKYYKEKMKKFGYTDISEPHTNIHLGVDVLSELLTKYKDIRLVLMLYSGRWDTAFKNYRNGHISNYAISVLSRAEELRGES